MQAVPITDIVKNSISSADIVTDPIISTSLESSTEMVKKCASCHIDMKVLHIALRGST